MKTQSSVFSLHKIASDDSSGLDGFPIKEYSRFKYGDDRVAYRAGTEVAKAFTSNALCIEDTGIEFVVAVAYEYTPNAAYALRNHFISYFNRHLLSRNCKPASKIDINRDMTYNVDYATQDRSTRARLINSAQFHIDRERVGDKTIIILDDIRVTGSHERRIQRMLEEAGIRNRVFFVYFGEVANSDISPTIESRLNSASVSSLKDIEAIAQGGQFVMNNRVVKDVLGRDHVEFCQFLRRQDDSFVFLLLDCAVGNRHYEVERYQENFRFLSWEVKSRESIN